MNIIRKIAAKPYPYRYFSSLSVVIRTLTATFGKMLEVGQDGRTRALEKDEVAQAQRVLELRKAVLSAFRELRFRDGIMPVGLLRHHFESEMVSTFPQVLQEMVEEGLIKFVYDEGYELGVKLTSLASMRSGRIPSNRGLV